MQATELNFIIKAKEGNQYRSLMKFPCGLRQKNYNIAYMQAQDTLKALKEHGLNCKLITKYLKVFKPNNYEQLHLAGV
jgi:hypothetical protein